MSLDLSLHMASHENGKHGLYQKLGEWRGRRDLNPRLPD
ncbi:hypothetical protein NSND_63071 [Nitrospira sp. ND1]|nr:hypothetical protein NSND_63071 [Nitrospira sp. ND1]